MARPVNADSTATKARILNAARDRFGEDGPAAVSVRDVASHAGVSLATVHHYFGTKHGLYQASIEAMYEELLRRADELAVPLAPGASLRSSIGVMVRSAFSFAREHRGALRLIMRTVIDRGEMTEPLRERYQLPSLERGARMLSAFTGAPEMEMRLALQSMTHVVLRYALSTDRELESLTGVKGPDSIARLEDHLEGAAMALLGLEDQQ